MSCCGCKPEIVFKQMESTKCYAKNPLLSHYENYVLQRLNKVNKIHRLLYCHPWFMSLRFHAFSVLQIFQRKSPYITELSLLYLFYSTLRRFQCLWLGCVELKTSGCCHNDIGRQAQFGNIKFNVNHILSRNSKSVNSGRDEMDPDACCVTLLAFVSRTIPFLHFSCSLRSLFGDRRKYNLWCGWKVKSCQAAYVSVNRLSK